MRIVLALVALVCAAEAAAWLTLLSMESSRPEAVLDSLVAETLNGFGTEEAEKWARRTADDDLGWKRPNLLSGTIVAQALPNLHGSKRTHNTPRLLALGGLGLKGPGRRGSDWAVELASATGWNTLSQHVAGYSPLQSVLAFETLIDARRPYAYVALSIYETDVLATRTRWLPLVDDTAPIPGFKPWIDTHTTPPRIVPPPMPSDPSTVPAFALQVAVHDEVGAQLPRRQFPALAQLPKLLHAWRADRRGDHRKQG